jgi:uncharacterized protein YdhG (YjbR/CyaY superfamily)
MNTYTTVDEYIKKADKDKQTLLQEVRNIIFATVKDAEEGIAYGMPAYTWNNKPLFYFAAMKGHLGLYPTPGPIVACKELLKEYSISKGCVRIQYGTTLPTTLIKKLLQARVKEIKL